MTPTYREELTEAELTSSRGDFSAPNSPDRPMPTGRSIGVSTRTCPPRGDRTAQRRICIQRTSRTRQGERRPRASQRRSSVAEQLVNAMTVIHKTPDIGGYPPNLAYYEQTCAAFSWSRALEGAAGARCRRICGTPS